jgi:hypothetical protein
LNESDEIALDSKPDADTCCCAAGRLFDKENILSKKIRKINQKNQVCFDNGLNYPNKKVETEENFLDREQGGKLDIELTSRVLGRGHF